MKNKDKFIDELLKSTCVLSQALSTQDAPPTSILGRKSDGRISPQKLDTSMMTGGAVITRNRDERGVESPQKSMNHDISEKSWAYFK
mmetsp:Transcript_26369/g.40256  ORF Transcript_26369/g.40256 Transcript_26369/m.40256 type:complete len:87 (-) Transcript_26369:6408-6668(-)